MHRNAVVAIVATTAIMATAAMKDNPGPAVVATTAMMATTLAALLAIVLQERASKTLRCSYDSHDE